MSSKHLIDFAARLAITLAIIHSLGSPPRQRLRTENCHWFLPISASERVFYSLRRINISSKNRA